MGQGGKERVGTVASTRQSSWKQNQGVYTKRKGKLGRGGKGNRGTRGLGFGTREKAGVLGTEGERRGRLLRKGKRSEGSKDRKRYRRSRHCLRKTPLASELDGLRGAGHLQLLYLRVAWEKW